MAVVALRAGLKADYVQVRIEDAVMGYKVLADSLSGRKVLALFDQRSNLLEPLLLFGDHALQELIGLELRVFLGHLLDAFFVSLHQSQAGRVGVQQEAMERCFHIAELMDGRRPDPVQRGSGPIVAHPHVELVDPVGSESEPGRSQQSQKDKNQNKQTDSGGRT